MPHTPGTPRTPGSGRKAGTPNKVTASIKEAFRLSFDEMGGATALTAWGRENRSAFYKLAARLIPTEMHMSGTDGEPIKVVFGGRYKPTNGHE